MPLVRTSHKDAFGVVKTLEAEGHTVTAIASDETGVYIATSVKATRKAPGEKEQRA